MYLRVLIAKKRFNAFCSLQDFTSVAFFLRILVNTIYRINSETEPRKTFGKRGKSKRLKRVCSSKSLKHVNHNQELVKEIYGECQIILRFVKILFSYAQSVLFLADCVSYYSSSLMLLLLLVWSASLVFLNLNCLHLRLYVNNNQRKNNICRKKGKQRKSKKTIGGVVSNKLSKLCFF